jgi:hypothetical protein
METVNQLILAKSVNIFRRKSSSEQTKQSTDSEIFKGSLRCCFDCTCGAAAFWSGVRKWNFLLKLQIAEPSEKTSYLALIDHLHTTDYSKFRSKIIYKKGKELNHFWLIAAFFRDWAASTQTGGA